VFACMAGVAYHVWPAPKPRGFSGLQFAAMTKAAAARAPLLTSRGALIANVIEDSPADQAGVQAGEVVGAVDGHPLNSAREASDLIAAKHPGDHVVLTLFDETSGDIHPRQVSVGFVAAPPVTRKLSVKPPRILAKEFFPPPGMAANAAWSKRILRGPTIKPIALVGLGQGQCNALAPDLWEVRGHAPDDSMFHVAAKSGFMHALYESTALNGADPRQVILASLKRNFGAATAAPSQPQPFGVTLFHYGLSRGAAGFVLYRVHGGRVMAWIVAVPAADIAWAEPLTGAVALSIRCPGAALPRPPKLSATNISASCIEGRCSDADYAGAYMSRLRLGFVHDADGLNYLINPKRDFWQDGAEGPGYYHQLGGTNEKLEPGRTN